MRRLKLRLNDLYMPSNVFEEYMWAGSVNRPIEPGVGANSWFWYYSSILFKHWKQT